MFDNIWVVDEMLKALQCPTRLRILEIIASNGHAVTSIEISDELNITQSIALRHLEELARAELLTSHRYQPPVGRPGTKFELNNEKCNDFEIVRLGTLKISLSLVEGGD